MYFDRWKISLLALPIVILFLTADPLGACLQAQLDKSEQFQGPPAVDVLGAHNNGGRGCASCHVAHSVSESGALWGSLLGPEYGYEIQFLGMHGLAGIERQSFRVGDAEVGGIILCISCHDGNVTPENMMASRTYAERVGLLPFVHGAQSPTLLDEFGTLYQVDHPVGLGAVIPVGDGLEFANGQFSVAPRSAYARFVSNYGALSLISVRRSNPFGVDPAGRPYVVCTTCHNQHSSGLYQSAAGELYSTFFYINGPYTPTTITHDYYAASAAMQFCRQCHFDLSNEGNNGDIPTLYR